MKNTLTLVALVAGAVLAMSWYVSGWRFGRSADVFILAGQSNMQGWASDAARYPHDPVLSDLRVKFFYARFPRMAHPEAGSAGRRENAVEAELGELRSRFEQAIARLTRHVPYPVRGERWTHLGPQWGLFPMHGHFGPEITFARRLLSIGLSPAIIKYAKEDTSIARDWKGPREGGLYDDLVRTVKRELAVLVEQGYEPRVRAFIWIQGEGDAADRLSAVAYRDRLESIIFHLRREVFQYEVPVVLGVSEDDPSVVANPEVLLAQQELAAALPCVARSSMAGLERADQTHLTAAGVADHGLKLFESYLALSGC